MTDRRVRALIASIAIAALESDAHAVPLFGIGVGSSHPLGFYEIDTNTGTPRLITTLRPFRLWHDLAGRDGDVGGVYAVSRLSGPGFVNQVSRIDITSGAVTDLFSVTAADLGFASPVVLEVSGIAFDPSDASVAAMLGVLRGVAGAPTAHTTVRFDLDMGSGGVSDIHLLEPAGAIASDLTSARDGTLFAWLQSGAGGVLARIDGAGNQVVAIGEDCTPATCLLRSIEFDPISGALYAVNTHGSLIILSPSTGAVLDVIGPTGIPAPGEQGAIWGLAFIPEPATGPLLMIGLALLARTRRSIRGMGVRCLRVSLVIAPFALATFASSAEATRLFAVANSPTDQRSLFEIDPTTGASSLIAPVPFRVWADISGRANDPTGVYGVSRVGGEAFQNHVSRLDVGSGAVSDLYSFTAADLGFADPDDGLELTGITFDPMDPSVALIIGVIFDRPTLDESRILFHLDMDTGAVSDLMSVTPSAPSGGDLSYGPDGTLYTIQGAFPAGTASQLATLDPNTGVRTRLGTCPGDCSIRAIEFDPFSGALFAVNVSGALVRLSSSTGTTLETFGSTGLSNRIQGLAFLVPEPATGSLLALGLVSLAMHGRRRRH